MQVVECSADSAAQWDQFVSANPRSTYCHQYGWRTVIEKAYGLHAHYLCLTENTGWRAIFPFAVMPSIPGMRRKGVSLPYCNYGDVVAAPEIDIADARNAFLRYLSTLGIHRIEVRTLSDQTELGTEVTMVLNLPGSRDDLWKALSNKVRNQIRKAQQQNFSLKWGRNELLPDFYSVYASNISDLGTPVHSQTFFKGILDEFALSSFLLVIYASGQAIGGMLLVKYKDCWADPFASTLREFNSLNPNMLMYWEALGRACDEGARQFDFGRSHVDSGTFRFKKNWGASVIALNYLNYVNLQPTTESSVERYQGRSSRFVSSCWARLPRTLQAKLGPVVRRFMP